MIETRDGTNLDAEFDLNVIPAKVVAPKPPKEDNPNKIWAMMGMGMMALNFIFLLIAAVGFGMTYANNP
jgi:hypothetical protein